MIYVASSWRNAFQPQVVRELRDAGHEVYDFRNPKPGDTGFSWSNIDAAWDSWTVEEFRAALDHPVAKAGFKSDMDALQACDTCVLIMPCGRSAHLELGWAVGAGKRTFILCPGDHEPELMYAMCGKICTDIGELLTELRK